MKENTKKVETSSSKHQSPCIRLITHRLTLRIANCHGIFLLIVANIIRLAHFASVETLHESKNQDGSVSIQREIVRVAFWFVITTIFILPPLITVFVIMEFRIKPHIFALYFNFLDNPIGKGIYLIFMALIIVEI